MGIEYFIIAVIIAIIYIWQKYTSRIKSGLVFPSTIFMLMWAFACFASVIVQAYDLLDDFGSGYKIVGPYIFLFILVSLLGFLLASKTIRINLDAYNFNSDYISYFLEKMKIFLYLSFLLGLVRIYFMVKIFGWETLYDYRQNALIASSIENNGIFDLVVQISSYIYVLATFSVVLLAIKQALTGFNLKEMLWYFILFSSQALSIGGRMFILDFISCFFFMFLLIRVRNKRILSNKEFTLVGSSFAILIVLIMILGIARNNGNEVESSADYYDKYLYIQDGIIYTSAVFELSPENAFDLDFGKNITSINREDTNFARFRDGINMELYLPFITGVIAPLYFDFGYWGSLFAWFIICFLGELAAYYAYNRGTIWGMLFIFVLIRFFYDTPLMVSGGRGFFRYLAVLLIIYWASRYLMLDFKSWQFNKQLSDSGDKLLDL